MEAGICEKPRVACRDCSLRELLPLTDAAIDGHLAGEHTLGLYPLLENDTCHLLAVDFDEQDWREDARAFLRSCRELGMPAALEISRSGEGAHVWVFFEEAVPAREARQLRADNGVARAATAFRKTVVAVASLALRGVITLVLASRTQGFWDPELQSHLFSRSERLSPWV